MAGKRIEKSPDGYYPLTIREVPGDAMLGLEAMADADGRSVEAEALYLLREAVRRRRKRETA